MVPNSIPVTIGLHPFFSFLPTTHNATRAYSIMDDWTLEHRNIVVTGGAKGIGLAVVHALLERGASMVIFCSRSPCEELVANLNQQYPRSETLHVACDVSTDQGRRDLVNFTQQHITALHGLVSNVGTNVRKPMSEQTEEEFYTIMRTNVDSAYFLAKLFLPLLEVASGASIVNVSSVAGVQSSGTGVAYAMSKAALNQMTRGLACEWASRKIRVNAVTPWMTMTPLLQEAISADPSQVDKAIAWTPMHRLAQPEEVAPPILFLLMAASRYITGQVLAIDGGLTAQGFDGPCVTPS